MSADPSQAIYSDRYASAYPSLYLAPWQKKHELNRTNLNRILSGFASPSPRWLDLACGQAWHFSVFPGRARMVGLDLSQAQLARARAASPHAQFLCADMTRPVLAPGSFDLISSFWAAYCYLHDRRRIASLVHSAIEWLAPGGSLYFEILLGRDLAAFNESLYAQRTAFSVTPLSEDFSEWQYDDVGGCHLMTSPPLQDFLDIVEPAFDSVEAIHDSGFMHHLIATGRR